MSAGVAPNAPDNVVTVPSPVANPKRPEHRPPPAVHLIAGGLGGMCGSVVTAPFDLVKTRLQSSMYHSTRTPDLAKEALSNASRRVNPLRTLLNAFMDTGAIIRDVYRYEGPTALFKGLGPTLVGVIPGRSINFFVYGNGKQLYADHFNHGKENSVIHLSAAATAGVITAAATNPIWVVKTVMQLQQQQRSSMAASTPPSGGSSSPSATKSSLSSSPPRRLPNVTSTTASSFSHSFRSITSPPLPLYRKPTSYSTTVAIFRQDGIRGFYKGLSASLLGVTEGTIQWTLYERFKLMANYGHQDQPNGSGGGGWKISLAAGGAKLVATIITYPHEVIRTRLRQPNVPGQPPKYVSLVQSFKLVVAEEGWRALYGGLSPHLLRVVPNAVTMYWVYENVVAAFAKPVPTTVTGNLRRD
ncbi:Pyrimidine nucleotide transporter, mitochondrial [Microbotryomycetes sp. JL221]|nr:Pyrimidine nucleotide transporter, mitochondrial [Microbotryomycetes sp. JL221]